LGLERLDSRHLQTAISCRLNDGRTKRMLGTEFSGGRIAQQIVSSPRCAVRKRHIGDGRLALRHRSRLIEDDRVEIMRLLQRLAAFDKDAGLGPLPRPDHDGRWGGQAHRAGAGNDEHSDHGL